MNVNFISHALFMILLLFNQFICLKYIWIIYIAYRIDWIIYEENGCGNNSSRPRKTKRE